VSSSNRSSSLLHNPAQQQTQLNQNAGESIIIGSFINKIFFTNDSEKLEDGRWRHKPGAAAFKTTLAGSLPCNENFSDVIGQWEIC